MLIPTLTLAIWALAIGLTLWGTWYALRQFSPLRVCGLDHGAAITILKPLKGADSGLKGNLETFFRLNYPDYRVIFCVAEPNDPAVPVVRDLLAANPDPRFSLIIGEKNFGPNPKINNLALGYEAATSDYIVISDSNVRVTPEYLRNLICEMSDDVGVLTSVVAGTEPLGLGGWLEASYLNTFYARWMHIAAAVGAPCVVGKSMLFKKSVAGRFGGLAVLGRYINEDYMTGIAMRRLGLKVKIVRDPIDQYIGSYSLKEFWSRHIRWGRIRKCQAPVAFLFEPFVGSASSGVFGAWAASSLFGVAWGPFLLVHFALWAACDAALAVRLGKKRSLVSLLCWGVRELVALPLWFHIACGNTVNWRGRSLRLHSGGLLTA